MTTIPFNPSSGSAPPFQASVTLDGTPYTLIAMWNVYRGYWYVSLYDQNNTLVINQPLLESPVGSTIYLFPGMFTTSTIYYQSSTNSFIVNP